MFRNSNREDVRVALTGDIAALAGLKDTITGEAFCDPESPVVLERMYFPDPVIKIAIEPKTKADIDKMAVGLVKLAQEDPSFHFSRDEEINQTVIEGMGELHLEIIVDRLKREYKVEANVGAPQVNYRESISKISQVRLELLEVTLIVFESEKEEVVSVHSEDSEAVSEPMAEAPPPTERLLGDYGGANAPTGRVTVVNQPFLEALEQMPSYAIFMKDIISKKRSIDTDSIVLTETCSVILQGMKIPVKKKYRGSVTIPFTIGDRSFKKALIDLGASVSLMPLSIYKRLGIGKV
ncbi:uncharacterized protein LOC127102037 [Lathyrus oleraceus]|uniref:uncharacterized protein LOC127102037 n=1 Tax=Pisum sativum TaxID=3888 RepID=UPI0021D31202|nr:uncharacterized protein LOC127102037 [Pisum sativum]